MKNILKNQKGISLVMVIVSLALVGIGTTVIVNLSRKNTLSYSRARSTTFSELERRRISAILSDNTACMKNFPSNPTMIAQYPLSQIYAKDGTTIVAIVNGKYFNSDITNAHGALTLKSITVQVSPYAAAKGLTGDKQYEMVLQYTDVNIAQQRGYKLDVTGKTGTLVRIPMYFKVIGGIIKDCYAMGENTDLDSVIKAACSPTTANLKKSDLITNNGISANCQNNITFDSNPQSDPNDIYTRSGTTTCPTGKLLSSVELVTGSFGNSLKFTAATNCSGLNNGTNGTCGTQYTAGYSLTASQLNCQYPGGSRDFDGGSSVCSTDQVIYRNGFSNTTCVTVKNCSGYSFIHSVSTAGASCFTAPTTNCAADQYVDVFNENGSDTCASLPIMSGSCGANSFGSGLTRASGTANGTLVCLAYSVNKSCGAPSSTTFAYAFSASGTASCTQW